MTESKAKQEHVKVEDKPVPAPPKRPEPQPFTQGEDVQAQNEQVEPDTREADAWEKGWSAGVYDLQTGRMKKNPFIK
jgi:hypothetical protein